MTRSNDLARDNRSHISDTLRYLLAKVRLKACPSGYFRTRIKRMNGFDSLILFIAVLLIDVLPRIIEQSGLESQIQKFIVRNV